MVLLNDIRTDVERIMNEWMEKDKIKSDHVLIVGCSTSEVAGKKICTSGSEEIAATIFHCLSKYSTEYNFHLAFQCCEHLNRAIVVDREVQQKFQLEEVTVIPVPEAGGSMASYAYKHLKEAVVVEEIKADAGIDIGDTMIGMHLKKVAVPLRFQQKTIGNAHVTAAKTRPKLIGGKRAKYPQ